MYQSTLIPLLLQFAFFSLALASPIALADETVAASAHGNSWSFGAGGGVLGFIVLVLDIIVWSMFPHTTRMDAN